MAQLNKSIRTRRSNVREMLIAAGVGQFNVTMSLPYVWFMPRTCDPYTQGVQQLVQAIQNVLNARGANLEVSGWLDPPTQAELARYSGPSWGDKTWVQLLGDVMNAPERKAPAMTSIDQPSSAVHGLGGFITDTVTSPIGLVAIGAAAWWFLGRRPRRRSAYSLVSSGRGPSEFERRMAGQAWIEPSGYTPEQKHRRQRAARRRARARSHR